MRRAASYRLEGARATEPVNPCQLVAGWLAYAALQVASERDWCPEAYIDDILGGVNSVMPRAQWIGACRLFVGPQEGFFSPFRTNWFMIDADLWQFMSIYFNEVIVIISVMRICTFFFSSAALPHGIDKAQGGCGTTKSMRFITPLICDS